jgi:DNA-binding response OmpR family regulator
MTKESFQDGARQQRNSVKHLLVVDDEPAVGRLIRRIAEGCGYIVTVTHDSDSFMRALHETQAQAIILDLSLPGKDGVELLRVLGQSGCRAEILIISGCDRRLLESTGKLGVARGLPIVGTMMKPVRAAELRAAILGLGQSTADG